LVLSFFVVCQATTYFSEDFSEGWEDRWVLSKNKEKDGTQGDFRVTAGKFYADENEKGLQTYPDARFFQISAKFDEFTNKDKPLVFQFSVKHEQKLDCGGGYFKLHPGGFDQENYHGETPYSIMFGPDICGSSTKRIHLIFNYKGTNHLWKKQVSCETDQLTHFYTLVLNSDQTYKVLIDNEEKAAGNLVDDWDFLPAKEINDPALSKPSDWVDEKEIADPEAKKPEGWDDVPEFVADPDATKPDDWDDELDGEWEAPMIDNPEYQGEWEAPMIPNPAYQGEWTHPRIPNPDYFEDSSIYSYSHGGVGLEVWQVKAGTIFDHILVSDDVDASKAEAEKLIESLKAEKDMFEKQEEERRQKEEEERKKREEERKAAEEDDEDTDEESDAEEEEDEMKDEL